VNRDQIAVISKKQENMAIKYVFGNSKKITIRKKLESNKKEEVTPVTPSQIKPPLHALPLTTEDSQIPSPTHNNTSLVVNSVAGGDGGDPISLSEASVSCCILFFYYYLFCCCSYFCLLSCFYFWRWIVLSFHGKNAFY
jgi:hypothetical protein